MPVWVDDARFEERGRIAGVAIAAHMLRAMERWRRDLDDYDCVMIMIAVIAIGSERLLRTGFPPGHAGLAAPMDRTLLRKVNISSIAHATGLNRETARRKVNDLVERGLLIRSEEGGVGFRPGLAQEEGSRDQVRSQLADIAAIANQLVSIGVLAEE